MNCLQGAFDGFLMGDVMGEYIRRLNVGQRYYGAYAGLVAMCTMRANDMLMGKGSPETNDFLRRNILDQAEKLVRAIDPTIVGQVVEVALVSISRETLLQVELHHRRVVQLTYSP